MARAKKEVVDETSSTPEVEIVVSETSSTPEVRDEAFYAKHTGAREDVIYG